jgi:uncharacterized protein YuzB (UPF0349 family)
MEIVLCQLTLQEVDNQLCAKLRAEFPAAQIVVASCIFCCGDCATHYVALKNGKEVRAQSYDQLLAALQETKNI